MEGINKTTSNEVLQKHIKEQGISLSGYTTVVILDAMEEFATSQKGEEAIAFHEFIRKNKYEHIGECMGEPVERIGMYRKANPPKRVTIPGGNRGAVGQGYQYFTISELYQLYKQQNNL